MNNDDGTEKLDAIEQEEIQQEGTPAKGVLGTIQRVLNWLRKNERHISAPIFILGFITDLFTVAPLPVTSAVYLYGSYLVVAFFASIGAHYLFVRREEEGWFLRSLRVVLSLAAQFTVGGTLSGCLIFYTKSAALVASWPFVLILIVLFVGNEFLRKYREQLVFRNLVFFFGLYAFVIYALPTQLHTISASTFLESTAVALGIYALYLLCLALAGWHRFREHFWRTLAGALVIALAICASYFGGAIPPLPLSLSQVGIYHSVTHQASGYVVQEEAMNVNAETGWRGFLNDFRAHTPWEQLQVVHISPGESLSVFSSVFAPTSFSTAIIHKWEWYNPQIHRWQQRAEIVFSIQGGRDGGYRGYSTLSNLTPGKYRVSIETLSGQVIGQVMFVVQQVDTKPPLQEETL